MRHLAHVLAAAVRHPRAAARGAREYRRAFTTHYGHPQIESYDAGQELAHMLTLRRYDA